MEIDDSWDKLYRERIKNKHFVKGKLNITDRWHRLIMIMLKIAKLNLRQKKVLEVGCGYGAFCGWLSKIPAKVNGVDITPWGLKSAQTFNKQFSWNLDLTLATGCKLPFKTESFDATLCTETLEHIPNYLLAFDEIIRVTKLKGYIIVTVPNYLNLTRINAIWELKKRLKLGKSQPEDVNLFTMFTLSELMKTRRLKPIIKGGIGLVELPINRGIALKIQRNYIDYPLSVLKAFGLNIGFIAQKVE